MTSSTPVISFQICDQCYRRRSKCSRQLPSCTRCLSKQVNCTYERETRQKTNVNSNPNFYQGKSTFSFKKRFFPRPNRKQLIKDSQSSKHESSPLSGTYIDCRDDWPQRQASLVKDFNSRSIYNMLGCMVGLPIRQNERPRLELLKVYIQLYSYFGINFTRSKTLLEASSQPTAGIAQYYCLLSSAKVAYFKHINPICPLFLESTFDEWNRPPLLMAAIWACGLSFLPKTDLSSKLISTLLTQILQTLGSVLFKPTLLNLQTLLVCLMGGKDFTSLSGVIIGKFELIVPIIFQLGLHKDLPKEKSNMSLILERRLAFSTVLYFNSGSIYGYGLSSAISPSQFNWNISLLKLVQQVTSSIKDLASVILSQSGYLSGMILSRLQVLRCAKHSKFEDIVQSGEFTKRKMEDSMRVMYRSIEDLRNSSHGSELLDMLDLFLFYLKARHESMLVYYYQTLYYCASSRSLPPAKANEYLFLSIIHCMRLIENTTRIPSPFCNYIFLGPCSFSVTWMASNKCHFPNHVAIDESIKLGLSIIKRGVSCPGIIQTSRILFGLSSCIVKSCGIN